MLRRGPQVIVPVSAFAAGVGIPLALMREIGQGRALLGIVLVGAALGALLIVRLRSRIEGWRMALVLLAAFVLFSVAR